MRGVLSVVRHSVARRSLTLSLGLCAFSAGCDSKSTANKPDTTAPAATPAPVAVTSAPVPDAPAFLPPDDRYVAGDRYAVTPRIDSAVQPVSYGEAPRAPVAAQPHVSMQLPGLREPTEEEFIAGGGPNLNITPSVRANPLPHSP